MGYFMTRYLCTFLPSLSTITPLGYYPIGVQYMQEGEMFRSGQYVIWRQVTRRRGLTVSVKHREAKVVMPGDLVGFTHIVTSENGQQKIRRVPTETLRPATSA